MKPKTYDTNEAKALRVLVCCGRAPVELKRLSEDEVAQLAALCDDAGVLCAGGQEKFRILQHEFLDARKATDADLDEPTEVEAE